MRDIRDLVERLRKNDAKAAISTAHAAPHSIQGEAADEIERLRSLLPQAGTKSADTARLDWLAKQDGAINHIGYGEYRDYWGKDYTLSIRQLADIGIIKDHG